MIDTRVEYTHFDSINSNIVSDQNEKAVVHHSESHLTHGITTVFQVSFMQINLTTVADWVVLSQQVERNLLLGHFDFESFRLILSDLFSW